LAAAETAADYTVSLVLNPNRAARLIANRALENQSPTLEEIIDTLLQRTWKSAPPADPYLAELHRVADNAALYNLMALASNAEGSAQVRAIAAYKLDQLKSWIQTQPSGSRNEAELAHFQFALAEIERYLEDPARFPVPKPAPIPAGAPIGTLDSPFPGIVWQDDTAHRGFPDK
jgi:hypothetical protein